MEDEYKDNQKVVEVLSTLNRYSNSFQGNLAKGRKSCAKCDPQKLNLV